MRVSDLVRLYYERIDPVPFILCPEVVADSRVVSVRSGARGTKPIIMATLKRLGYVATVENGVTMICAVPETIEVRDAPAAEPKASSEERPRPRERVMGKIELGAIRRNFEDRPEDRVNCTAYVTSVLASDDGSQASCYRGTYRPFDKRLAQRNVIEAARDRVEGPAR